MKNYRAARKRVTVSVGESVRIIRELQGLSCKRTTLAVEHRGLSDGGGRLQISAFLVYRWNTS